AGPRARRVGDRVGYQAADREVGADRAAGQDAEEGDVLLRQSGKGGAERQQRSTGEESPAVHQLTPTTRLIVGPIASCSTRSASSSWSVGSRFRMTSLAPRRLAMRGN